MAEDFEGFLIEAKLLRQILDSVFSEDTAAPGTYTLNHPTTRPTTPSAGHCAVSAILVDCLLGPSAGPGGSCQFVSTKVNSDGSFDSPTPNQPLISHWFNRVRFSYETPYGPEVDIDLTGDQFGRPAIQIGPAGSLYSNTIIREETSLNQETLDRALLLLERVKVLLDAKAEIFGIYGEGDKAGEDDAQIGDDSPE